MLRVLLLGHKKIMGVNRGFLLCCLFSSFISLSRSYACVFVVLIFSVNSICTCVFVFPLVFDSHAMTFDASFHAQSQGVLRLHRRPGTQNVDTFHPVENLVF